MTSRKIGFDAPEHQRPTGWKWDEMIWTEKHERHQVVIPTLMDPDIALIPEVAWQSGIGDGEDLKIMKVVEDPHSGAPWRPVIKPGFYYIASEQFYLFGKNSVIAFGGTETNVDGLTQVDLFWPPKSGAPMSIAFLHRRSDGDVRDADNFRHRVRFTGQTQIKTDQYGDLLSKLEVIDRDSDGNVFNYNISNLPNPPEPRPLEYIVIERPEKQHKEWLSQEAGRGEDTIVTLTLENTPVFGPPIAFSNQALFLTYLHDTVPNAPGEYSIGYSDSVNINPGTVQVKTDTNDQEPGFVSYWSDFPATILFNDEYVKRIGFEGWPRSAGPPPFGLVTQTDYIGQSKMLPNQAFYLSYFPVLTPEDVRVFIYDPRNEDLTSEWTRVEDFVESGPGDEHFVVSPDGGFVLFGDGISGKIPHRYAFIGANYQYVPFIEYMPGEDWVPIKPDSVDLQPLHNSSSRGFIYIGHKEPIVDRLVLVTDRARVPERLDTYGPIDAGNDFALLTCTAYAIDGDVVPDQELSWHLVPPTGYINGTNPYYTAVKTHTDNSGRSRVVYTPVRTAGDMGVIVDLFEGEGDPLWSESAVGVNDGVIRETYQANDSLILPEPVETDVSQMYVFLVLDDDPLLPYDPKRREGGRYVILYHWDEDYYSSQAGEWVPVQPSEMFGRKTLVFPDSLPTPEDYPQLVQYAILMDRIITVNATTLNAVTGIQIVSNDLKLYIRIPEAQKGVFTLSGTSFEGSVMDSASYLTIARDGTVRFLFEGVTSTTSTSSTSTTSTTTSSTSTTSSTASTSSSTSTSTTVTSTSSSTTTSTTTSTVSTSSSTSTTSTSATSSSSTTSTTGSSSTSSSSTTTMTTGTTLSSTTSSSTTTTTNTESTTSSTTGTTVSTTSTTSSTSTTYTQSSTSSTTSTTATTSSSSTTTVSVIP